MTEDNQAQNKPTPSKRGRPKKVKPSAEAEKLFPEYISSEDRVNQLEHDVDDLFAGIEETDLRTEASTPAYKESESYYARKPSAVSATPKTDDINADPHKTITSPKLTKENLNDMIRAEELAADIVKEKGRFIDGVDNAKAGVTFRGPDPSINPAHLSSLEGMDYNSPLPVHQQQYIQNPKHDMKSDGITLKGILDTGAGAQRPEKKVEVSDRDNPESPSFMVCVNKECRYRENCMRYRLNNQRSMKSVFYPEDCRRDGIFMSVDESDFTAYDPLNILESTATPSF